MYRIVITKAAEKDKEKVKAIPALMANTDKLIAILRVSPFRNPPPYEKLVGDFKGLYSRRINRQHRLVYEVLEEEKVVKIVSLWSHYE